MIKYKGELEVDYTRGVIYFHTNEGYTILRICRLPVPLPEVGPETLLDITHMHGVSWAATKTPFDGIRLE